MNKDILRGEWNLIKGKVKEKWGKLTDDDLTVINGKREQLSGEIQKKYGYTKEKAEQELADWEKQSDRKNHAGDQQTTEKGDKFKHTNKH